MKTTGIGSLPFTDTKSAWSFAKQHSLVFLPTLPKLQNHESMLEQCRLFLAGAPLAKLFCCSEYLSDVSQIKWQMMGPLSYWWYATQRDEDELAYIIEIYQKNFTRLRAEISNKVKKDLFFIDEPGLEFIPKKYYASLHFLAVLPDSGIHCCSRANWDILVTQNWDMISFDWKFRSKELMHHPTRLCIGAIDTNTCEVYPDFLAEAQFAMVSASCGLALLNLEQCEKVDFALSKLIS